MDTDPNQIPKGKSPEVTPGHAKNPLGVYLHKPTGERLTALSHPAADAFVLQGFEYEGPVPENAKASNKASAPSEGEGSNEPTAEELKQQLEAERKARLAAEKKAKQESEARAKAEADAEAAKKAATDAQKGNGSQDNGGNN